MINNIYFISNDFTWTKKISLNNGIVFLTSKSDNQSGKTTVLDTIPFAFDFNKEYLDKKLRFTNNKFLNDCHIAVEINNNKLLSLRNSKNKITDSNGNEIYKKSIIEFKLSEKNSEDDEWNISEIEIVRNDYARNKVFFPELINFIETTYISPDAPGKGYIINNVDREFSFGNYYQIFFVEESIGWTRYDWPKIGGKTYGNYNKYTINTLLYNVINSDDKIMKFENELRSFHIKNSEMQNRIAEINAKNELIDLADYQTKITNDLKIFDTKEKTIGGAEGHFKKIHDLEIELAKLKKRKIFINRRKHLISLRENYIDEISKVSFGKAINISKLVFISEISKNDFENSENEISEIADKISTVKKKLDAERSIIEKIYKPYFEKAVNHSVEESIASNKINFESEVINEMYQSKDKNEYLKNFIQEIIDENRKRIISQQKNIIVKMRNEITKLLNLEIEKYDYETLNSAIQKLVQKTSELEKYVEEPQYKGWGAMEPVYVLTERISIINEMREDLKIPIFILDTPYKGEIEEENGKINIFKRMIDYLLKELFKLQAIGKIEQVIIASAKINVENFSEFKIETVSMDSISKKDDYTFE